MGKLADISTNPSTQHAISFQQFICSKLYLGFVFTLMACINLPAYILQIPALETNLDEMFVLLISAPFFEELAFRGVMLEQLGGVSPRLKRKWLDISVANLLVSLLFVGAHGDIWFGTHWVLFEASRQVDVYSLSSRILSLFLISLCIGVVYERYRNITFCMLMHFTLNCLATFTFVGGE